MRKQSHSYAVSLLAVSMLVILACNLVAPAPSHASTTEPSAEPATVAVEASATQLQQPTTTPAAPTATTGPQCTVLQQLNLRSGPGTAYDPPLTAFEANTILVPTGYSAAGTPGGTWVQVEEPISQQKGWVSAGSAYVSCNIDLTKLPTVAVAPPPQPQKPKAKGSTGEGPCAEGGTDSLDGQHHFDCKILLASGFPSESQYFEDGKKIGKAEINSVLFRVLLDGNEIYSNSEKNPPYCLFGGGSPCNSWTFEDGVYKFESGGAEVQPGDYTVEIDPEMQDPTIDLHWDNTFHITLP